MVTGNTKKSSYTCYYFSSIEEGHDEDYQVYIIFYIQEDLKYMEICVMDETEETYVVIYRSMIRGKNVK